jgi:hypothetical protein
MEELNDLSCDGNDDNSAHYLVSFKILSLNLGKGLKKRWSNNKNEQRVSQFIAFN